MKKIFFILSVALIAHSSRSQVGIGTTTPNTTLDVRGSLSLNSRTFATDQSVSITDHSLLFNGASATTLTLPDAVIFPGRAIQIKNSNTGTVPVLTIATVSSQTVDGNTNWLLDDPNESVNIISDGANWKVTGQSLPNGSGSAWTLGGNTVGSSQKIGTKSAHSLPFITNDLTRMTITETGNIGIGSTDFTASPNAEKLLIDAGTSSSYNLIGAYGERNGYLQFVIQNNSPLGHASTDIVASADNGTELINYVDLGINSSLYNNGSTNLLNGPNNAYLYSKGQDFVIGNASTSKSIIFFTGGDAPANEKFRLNTSGIVTKSDLFPTSDGTYFLGKSSNRWNTVYSQNGVLTTSDKRLKINIQSLNYGLSEVLALNPVRYNWLNNSYGENKIGLLAQEVKAVVPEVVIGDETKENLAMNYAELVPVLINAIKEQQQQIDELKKQVTELKNK